EGLAGPTRRGERLGVARGDPDLVDVLAEPDIRRPAAELGAARDVEDRHPIPPMPGNNDDALTVTSRFSTPSQTPGSRHAAADRIRHPCSHLVEHGVWPNQYRLRGSW